MQCTCLSDVLGSEYIKEELLRLTVGVWTYWNWCHLQGVTVHHVVTSCYVAALWLNQPAWHHQSLATSWSLDCGASYTMATWPLRDRKTAQVAEWGEGGEEEGGGRGETDSEGGIRSLGGWGRQSRGEGVNRRRRQASFLIKTDHSHLP